MRRWGLGWLWLALLLGGCESRPAGPRSINEIVADTVVLRAAPVAAPAGADSLGLLPRASLPPPCPLPLDTSQLGARRAVLRQAVLPADTSALLIPKAGRLLRHPVRLLPGQAGYHRYVGTLGGQPVVVELTGTQSWGRTGTGFSGSYYFQWGGPAYSLTMPEHFRSDKPLLLIEQSDNHEADTTATWRSVQRLGATLTGTWTDKRTRRTARFALHESYAGAVRYEVLDETVYSGDSCRWGSDGKDIYYRRGYVQWESLHLLGPDTLRPALCRLQCLTPGKRRRAMRRQLPELNCNEGPPITFGVLSQVLVNYNSDGLLAITTIAGDDVGAAYPMDGPTEHLYDLTTGRACRLVDWLRAEKMAEFRQLLTRYLVADETGWDGRDDQLFRNSGGVMEEVPPLLLTSTGLAFRLAGFGQRHATHLMPVTIPYAALAPYVRPGTPLARLVATRTRPRQ